MPPLISDTLRSASQPDLSAPKISIVIPARDAAVTLPACLEALARQTVRGEIIVVNDGSSDATAEAAARGGARTITILPSGPAAARNAGAGAASGDIVLFTDADCAPAADWAEQMAAAFGDSAVVGAKGAYRTRQRGLVPRFVQLEYESKYERMARLPRIDFIDTYAAAYRRDVFLANGGFETAFSTASVEDQELSFRLAGKGYKLVFVPAAVVYHAHDANISEYARRKFMIGYWKAYLLRWHPEKVLGDDHTPPSQRLQIVLLGAALASAAVSPWSAAVGWGAAIAAGAFWVSTVPFLIFIARRDPAVLAAAPLLMLLRAGSLAAGLVAGAIGLSRRASPRRARMSLVERGLKRLLDVIVSAAALLLMLPAAAIIAVAVKLDSPGPVLFVQQRVGENGRPFRLMKFRSMVANADRDSPRPVSAQGVAISVLKAPDDPRVTRVGRFLRRWSLDELPQFWNVLRGEMTLVGPRPEEVRVVAQYSDWHRQRLTARPGITGPMQINGRGELGLDERVRLELDYIENYSIWKDVVILVKTVPAVLSGRGAY